MGCCNSTVNTPSSNVVGESVPTGPVTVATSHPLVLEHSSDTLYRPRGRAPSAHHPTSCNTAQSHQTPRNRVLSASQEMNSASMRSSMKAQTSLRSSKGSRPSPRHTNPSKSDALLNYKPSITARTYKRGLGHSLQRCGKCSLITPSM